MRRLVTLVLLLLLARAAASAADKDVISLQRDVALVDDRIRTLQQSTDNELMAITTLLQQMLQRLSEMDTDNAALHSSYINGTHRQERVLEEVHSIVAKVDRVTVELRATRDVVADVTTRLRQVEAKLTDLDRTVRIIQLPPPPPPGSDSVSSGSAGAGASAETPESPDLRRSVGAKRTHQIRK